jgi:hypothetical protein
MSKFGLSIVPIILSVKSKYYLLSITHFMLETQLFKESSTFKREFTTMNKILPLVSVDGYYSLNGEEIPLTNIQISEAVKASSRVLDRELQWRVYLNLLALSGFNNWLEERDDELKIDTSQCQLLSDSPAIPTANHLEIGDFKVCVLSKDCLNGEYVNIPQAILTNPAEAAHFYVIVDVLEEIAQVLMFGFLRHDRLERYLQIEPLKALRDNTYDLPTRWLNSDFDELLSYLRCFNPIGIPLPDMAISSQKSSLNTIYSKLKRYLKCRWLDIVERI